VLDTSRIEAGTFSYAFTDVDLAALVEESVAAASLAQDEVRVRAAVHGPMASVRGDRERLRQVLSNLIDNAVKYSRTGAEVEVAAASEDGAVRSAASSSARAAIASRRSCGSSTTASPRCAKISPSSHCSLPTGRSAIAAPSSSGRAPRSSCQRAILGEYQMRAMRAFLNRPGSNSARGPNRFFPSRALRIRSSRKLRSPSRVRSQVWTRQFGSSRSSEYGSTSRVEGA